MVRQEGLSKEETVIRVADSQGLRDKTEEIQNSLDRIWRYESALTEQLGDQMPKPEEFWMPGILREQLYQSLAKADDWGASAIPVCRESNERARGGGSARN